MKRQFKHKQSQDVVEQVSVNSGYYQSTKVPMANAVSAKYIENTNDWVEITKVQPKEWEITAFRSILKGYIWELNKNGYYQTSNSVQNDLDSMLTKGFTCVKTGNVEIYSIRRLSDNVEFKIGDVLVSGCGKQKIIAISIDKYNEKNIWLHYFTDKYSQCTYRLNEVKKAEKLFTTEDGIDIFEENPYTYVHLHSWHIDHAIANKTFNSINCKSAYSKYFSTKEAAEEYVLINKPCLSINDLKGIFDYFGNRGNNEYMLKQLVKTKL